MRSGDYSFATDIEHPLDVPENQHRQGRALVTFAQFIYRLSRPIQPSQPRFCEPSGVVSRT